MRPYFNHWGSMDYTGWQWGTVVSSYYKGRGIAVTIHIWKWTFEMGLAVE